MVARKFDSEALRVNLARTRTEVRIPPEHQRLLELCEAQFGIHGRAEAFLRELHHPFPNVAHLISELRTLALSDLWFFRSCAQPREALGVLAGVFERLFALEMGPEHRERAAETLLEFMAGLHWDPRAAEELAPVVADCVRTLESALTADPMVLARASSFLRTYGCPLGRQPACAGTLSALLERALKASLDLWQRTADLEGWYRERRQLFEEDHSELFGELGRDYFEGHRRALAAAADWGGLEKIPDFNAIAERFRALMDDVESLFDRSRYILWLLGLPGEQHRSPQLLWDLNRAFRSLHALQCPERLSAFIDTVFDGFAELGEANMSAVLDCIGSLGEAAYASGDRAVVDRFLDRTIRFGFVPPGLAGVGDDWQVEADPNHVKNIRVWIGLIACNPEWSSRLVSALIINLKVGGVFIADTDLFQRDVTRLLNARIQPCYKLILQLGRLFPVYFDEIGAEGELRDVTTRMDEASARADRLVHFLRKGVHAESNCTHIELTREIAKYWHDGDPTRLAELLPEDVRGELTGAGRWFGPVHRAMGALCERLELSPEGVLRLPPDRVEPVLAALEGLGEADRQRVLGLVRLHGLLEHKYSLDASGVLPHMRRLSVRSSMVTACDIDLLEGLLANGDPERALNFVFGLLKRLREVILDPRPTEGEEDIFHKRHIAAGIPSMYGRYFEPKFAALGLTFRLESLATRLLEQTIRGINLGYLSRKTLRQAARVLELFREGLAIAGVDSKALDSQLAMLHYSLKTTSFSLTQFVNIFQFIADSVKQIIRDYFLRHHDETLPVVLTQVLRRRDGHAPPGDGLTREIHKCSEEFYRGLLSAAFLITPLDGFIAAVLDKLNALRDRVPPEIVQRVMSFDGDSILSPIGQATVDLDNQVFLGAKGYFLKKLHAFGFRVPPGFVLTTELFRIRGTFEACPELREEVTTSILRAVRGLEAQTGKRLGDPTRPLLLSVRSGAAVSMPGAMNTFLNVGLNDEVVEGLSRQPNYGWTSWDCYRRSLQTWGMAHGIPRDDFDRLIMEFKRQFGVKEKVQFTPAQMRTIAFAYRDLLRERGVRFEEDPTRQLLTAVLSVLNSWDTPRAWVYRKRLSIADEWGTAVIVQAMVLGNIGYDSGTGVAFTRDPFVAEPGVSLYGDFTTTSQGEDVVAGLVHPWPISRRQLERSPVEGGISLETHFPDIYRELVERANELVHHRGLGHQELEFTFESSRREDLYILQTRGHATSLQQRQPMFIAEDLEEHLIGRGIGIGGGAMNGRVAFDAEDLARLARDYPGEDRILVRPDTVPDDIGMIFECDGLLTARGGAASHAAVTACRLGKVCVVNCRVLSVFEDRKTCTINGVEFRPGDEVAIDGRLGAIYRGWHRTAMSTVDGVC